MIGGSAQGARLDALTRELAERWRQTTDSWRDIQAREFHQQYIEPLQTSVNAASRGIDELMSVLRKIRTDCE